MGATWVGSWKACCPVWVLFHLGQFGRDHVLLSGTCLAWDGSVWVGWGLLKFPHHLYLLIYCVRTLMLVSPQHLLHTSQVPSRRGLSVSHPSYASFGGRKVGRKSWLDISLKCKQVTSPQEHALAFEVFEPSKHLSWRKGSSCQGRWWFGSHIVFSNKPSHFLSWLTRNHKRTKPSLSQPQLQVIKGLFFCLSYCLAYLHMYHARCSQGWLQHWWQPCCLLLLL